MKFNFLNKFFKSKKEREVFKIEEKSQNFENIEELDSEFMENELIHYDENVDFYYTNIINSLILYTYDVTKLNEMASILLDPLTELYEELDYAFLPALFETVFRNELINKQFKEELLIFKKKVDNVPVELWDFDIMDVNETWLEIRKNAEDLLNRLNIESRLYNTDYTTIIYKK